MATTPPVCDFGWPAAPFRLPDTRGTLHDLDTLRGPKGLVIVFICNHCPYVLAVVDRLSSEARALAALGVGFAGICSNDPVAYPADSYENMQRFAEEHRLAFPYLHDADQSVARAYGAACTPDFFGFDAGLALQYRGRLDDAGRSAAPPQRRELFEAMRQVAETGAGPREQVPSMGCSIKWRAA